MVFSSSTLQENGAFFVTTDMIITPDQTQTTCPESPEVKGAVCRNESDCQANQPTLYGHGKDYLISGLLSFSNIFFI